MMPESRRLKRITVTAVCPGVTLDNHDAGIQEVETPGCMPAPPCGFKMIAREFLI